jgi:hypothetical protein
MVLKRCAMISTVLPTTSLRRASCTAALAVGVEGAGGLVEDQDRGIAEEGTGDRDALFLAAGETGPAFAYDRVVALGLVADEFIRVGGDRGGDDFLAGGVFAAKAEVVINRIVEQNGLLGNEGNVPP